MFDDEEELKDWETKEEDPPEQLKRKWIVESLRPKPPVICPACKQPVSADALTCLFCGAQIFEGKSGFLIHFLAWIKRFFRN